MLLFKAVNLGLTSLIVLALAGLYQPAFSSVSLPGSFPGGCLSCADILKLVPKTFNTSKLPPGCLGRASDKVRENLAQRSPSSSRQATTNTHLASSNVHSVSPTASPAGFSINTSPHVNVGGFNGHVATTGASSVHASSPIGSSLAKSAAPASSSAGNPTTAKGSSPAASTSTSNPPMATASTHAPNAGTAPQFTPTGHAVTPASGIFTDGTHIFLQ